MKFYGQELYKKWTRQAVECYKRNCRCEGCILNSLESRCTMKKAVIELVKKFGIPNDELLTGVKPRHRQIIDAILNGCNTKTQICKYTGLKDFQVQIAIGEICVIVIEQGYEFINTSNRLPELVEYIRGLYDERE